MRHFSPTGAGPSQFSHKFSRVIDLQFNQPHTYHRVFFHSFPLHTKLKQVPAIYLSNYSRAIDLADELSLARPDQSYRDTLDKACEDLLDNPLAVYMVYSLEEGVDR